MALRDSLWRTPGFTRWGAASFVSTIGTQITALALPLAAVLQFRAAPEQLGVLAAAQSIPALVIGIFAGVWVDRLPTVGVMVFTYLGRAAVLVAVPIAGVCGVLTLEHLYLVALLVGALAAFEQPAGVSSLAELIPKDRQLEGNSQVMVIGLSANVVGKGLGGLLIELLTASVAMAFDAATYFVSGLLLIALRLPFPKSAPRKKPEVRRELNEAFGVIRADPHLLTLTWSNALLLFLISCLLVVRTPYFVHDLQLTPLQIGLISACGNLGGLAAGLVITRLVARTGVGRAYGLALALIGASTLVIAGAQGLGDWVTFGVLCTASVMGMMGVTGLHVISQSARLTHAPADMQARVAAAFGFWANVAQAAGALAGGFLGGAFGLRSGILAIAAAQLLVAGSILGTPLRKRVRP
jgi:MFS family permease